MTVALPSGLPREQDRACVKLREELGQPFALKRLLNGLGDELRNTAAADPLSKKPPYRTRHADRELLDAASHGKMLLG
ncbi:MAG: hypothetical protein ACOZIN_01865 [Myxococcota bacterium]